MEAHYSPNVAVGWGRNPAKQFTLAIIVNGQPFLACTLTSDEEKSLKAALGGIAIPTEPALAPVQLRRA